MIKPNSHFFALSPKLLFCDHSQPKIPKKRNVGKSYIVTCWQGMISKRRQGEYIFHISNLEDDYVLKTKNKTTGLEYDRSRIKATIDAMKMIKSIKKNFKRLEELWMALMPIMGKI